MSPILRVFIKFYSQPWFSRTWIIAASSRFCGDYFFFLAAFFARVFFADFRDDAAERCGVFFTDRFVAKRMAFFSRRPFYFPGDPLCRDLFLWVPGYDLCGFFFFLIIVVVTPAMGIAHGDHRREDVVPGLAASS